MLMLARTGDTGHASTIPMIAAQDCPTTVGTATSGRTVPGLIPPRTHPSTSR
jgi:hypothetical protein